MLSFLNSIVLPALVAVSIPIIIHFFNRRKVKKIPFSSIRFLKLIESQRIKQVRLYQILLIIIRTLFILFLILAFARPTLNSTLLPATGTARTTAVILLDDSYSMQGFEKSRSKFQISLEYLQKILDTFDPADQVFILPVSRNQKNLSPVDLRQDFSELVRRYNSSYYTPNFSASFDNAAKIFQKYPNFNRELYLLSDLRINQMQFSDSLSGYLEKENIKLILINPEKEKQLNNTGIDTVFFETQLFEVNKPVHLTVKLHNYNLVEGREALVNLFGNENRLAIDQVIIPPAQDKQVTMSYIPKSTGYQFLHFELDDDVLLTDNYYFLSFLIPEKREILFVSDRVLPELAIALQTLNQGTILNFDQVNYSQWIGRSFEKYDLIILNDPPLLNTDLIDRVKLFAQRKNLLIIPGLGQTVRQMNSFLNSLSGRNLIIDLQSTAGDNYFYPLEPNLARHPLFAPVFSEGSAQPELPKIYKYFKMIKIADPIIRLENGDPLFANIPTEDKSHLFIFSSAFDAEWNDFSIKGFFIPMLYRIFFTTAHDYKNQQIRTIGDLFTTNLPLQAMDQFTLQVSGSEPYSIFPDQISSGLQFAFEDLAEPGHYIIRSNQTIVHAFSVNVSSNELTQPYINFDKIFPDVFEPDIDKDIGEQILSFRTGQELWYFFLALGFLMLILEMILVRQIEKQQVS